MSVKGIMTDYFERLLDYWNEKYNTFPKAPWDEGMNPLLYLSEPDEEEYIFWKPVENMQLVPTEINAKFGHLGGVGEINAGAFEPGGFANK